MAINRNERGEDPVIRRDALRAVRKAALQFQNQKRSKIMKDITKTYNVKHEFGYTEVSPLAEGFPIKLNINMTFQTFAYLAILICIIGFIVCELIEKIVK